MERNMSKMSKYVICKSSLSEYDAVFSYKVNDTCLVLRQCVDK